MIQNQNLEINQFLQSKLTNNQRHYNHSIKVINHKETYLSQNILNKTSKKIAQSLEHLNEDYLNFNNNNLKISYKETSNNGIKNYYSINSHNHSEYITNYSSDNFPKMIMSRRDNVKTEIKARKNLDSFNEYYNKTEDKRISRAGSGNYKSKLEENLNNKYSQKKSRISYTEENRNTNIIQSSPSQPILFKSIDLDGNNDRKNKYNNNYKDRRIYKEKTYNKKTSPKYQNSSGLEENTYNHSISNIHSDTENLTKQIKNYKSSNIILNKKNIINNDMHIYVNSILDNNINIKNNYKYHSITIRSKNKTDKEEMCVDFKKKYNINTNRINLNNIEILNQNLLNNRKNRSPITSSSNNKNNNIYNNRVLDNKENENKDITNYYQNHLLFESINLKNMKAKDKSEKSDINNNINTFLDSVKIIANKNYLYLNNNINSRRIQFNENKNSKKIPIKISKESDFANSISKNKKKNEIKNNFIFESKEKNNHFGYDSDIHLEKEYKKDINTLDKNNNNIFIEKRLDNNKISFIYERKKKKQKSLTEASKELNMLIDKETITPNNDSNNPNINYYINENIKKNLGNVLKKIIKKSNNRKQKMKKISIRDHNINENEQQSIIKSNYCKTEGRNNNKSNEKKEKKIKKSNSNYMLENKEFVNEKRMNLQRNKIRKKIYKMEICKVNDIIYFGNKNMYKDKEIKNKLLNKSNNNNNIIIIINNADKNKFKRIIKTPKTTKSNIKNLINDKTSYNIKNKSSEKINCKNNTENLTKKEVSILTEKNHLINSNNIKIKKSIIKKKNNENNNIKIKKDFINNTFNRINNIDNKNEKKNLIEIANQNEKKKG